MGTHQSLRSAVALLREGHRFLRENDLKTVGSAINSKNAHPLIQFAKYGVCGVLATVVHVGLFYLFALTLFPMALDHSAVELALRRNNAMYSNLVAFPLSSTFVYVTNAFWVFTGGRHHRVKEFLIFTLVNAISFAAGLVAGPQLIKWFGINTHLAQASFVVTSALVNFVIRKFLVFKN